MKRKPAVKTLPRIFRHASDVERTLQLIPHQELEALRTGKGKEVSFHRIAARLNIGFVAAQWHWPENKPAILALNQSLDAIVAVQNRYVDTRKWGVSGDEFKSIGAALVLTDDIQVALTRKDFSEVVLHVLEISGKPPQRIQVPGAPGEAQ